MGNMEFVIERNDINNHSHMKDGAPHTVSSAQNDEFFALYTRVPANTRYLGESHLAFELKGLMVLFRKCAEIEMKMMQIAKDTALE